MQTQQFFIAECRFGNISNIVPIRAQTYIASLPIAHITKDVLIVHRDVAFNGNALTGAWVVTHAETGFSVGHGKTRKQALENTTARLLSLPASDSYDRAINNARRMLAEYKAAH